MSLSTVCLALAPILAAPAHATGVERAAPALAPLPAADEAALLVPEDAFVVLRFQSAQSLLGLVQAFASMAEGNVPADVAALLELMEVPGDRSQIDPARPALLAFSLGGGAPLPTAVLPTLDAAAYAASLAGEGNLTTAVSGAYVGFSGTRNYAIRSEPNPLVAGLGSSLVSGHMDLGSLIQTYRPMIEMGLDQAEMMLDQMDSDPDMPMDMGSMLELYMDGVWAFVDSAAGLDMAVDFDGRNLSMRGDLQTKPKSPMAAYGGDATFDLHPAAAYLDPEAGVSMLMACDFARAYEQWEPLMEALFAAYPDPLASDLRRYMDAYKATLPLMGHLAAASGDLAPGGMRMVYDMPAEQPAELAVSLAAVFAELAQGSEGSSFSIAPPVPVTLGKQSALRSHLSFDMQTMLAGVTGQDLEATPEIEQLQQMMEAIYGAGGMDITMGATPERLVMVLGGDAAYAERAFARAPTKFADLPADLRGAIDAASGGSTCIVYRFDYGQIMSQMSAAMAGMGLGDLSQLQSLDTPFPVTAWMGIRGTTWSTGTSLDIQGLKAFVEAVEGIESSEEIEGKLEEPEEEDF